MNYNISKEYIKVLELIQKAGTEILKIYETDFNHEIKDDNSPITIADITSNNILVNGLNKYFNYEIISEESSIKIKDKTKPIWIIDPLDGTRDFIQKTGEFSIMIGLIKNGEPIFGVVYAPVLKKLYFAEKGKGSFVKYENSKIEKLKVSNEKNIENFRILRSRNHYHEINKKIDTELNCKEHILSGSLGIKFGLIAEGKGDLTYYFTNKLGIWDACGPEIILKEAGGNVTDILGKQLFYDLDKKNLERGVVGFNNYCSEILYKTFKKYIPDKFKKTILK